MKFEMIYFEIKSLFFSLMKRTKNQGWGMVVKAQISILWEISLRSALFCSLLNSLILPVIFCEASDKNLAFQFANKTQQSQGRKGIMNWGLWFMNEINLSWILKWYLLKLNLCSFPWWKEPKIKASGWLLKIKRSNEF